ncbi:MAG: hypothetical protein V4683_05020 [Bacteroidota bacterium]
MKKNDYNLKTLILLISCLFILSGCGMRFYKSILIESENFEEKIDHAIEFNKYFFIHKGEEKWHLVNPTKFNENGKLNIIGKLEKVGFNEGAMWEKLELNRGKRENLAFSPRFGKRNIASRQIHLFMPDSLAMPTDFSIPIVNIKKIEDYVTAPGATLVSHLALNTIPPLILIAIMCNCPYVYSYDNSKLNFEGNLYSGAIYPNLERNDYLTIPNMAITDGKYKFRLENPRDDEQQFTNFMQMMVVHHSDQVRVLPDRKGILHTIKDLQKPEEAVSFDSKNQLSEVTEKDGRFYQFSEYQDKERLNGVVLKFKNESKSTNPKLVLSLKNSDWAGYVYKEGVSLFGDKLPAWRKKQMKRSGEEINTRAIAQGTLMSAYLKTNEGWKLIDYINTPGSVTARDLILPLEITDTKSDIEIMLKGGFRFWDLDYAAMDFSQDEALQIDYLQPKSVIDLLGKDHSESLLSDDSSYLKQLTVNDKFDITFDNIPKKENLSQTMILNGKGYYNRLDKVEGRPQLSELWKIKKSGFSAFSKKKYLEIANLYAATKP